MPFAIPQPIRTYNNPAPVLPSRVFQLPAEGRRIVPIELDWNPAQFISLYVNVQGITTQPFSQIVMLDVDNSQCGAAVTFFFNDTQDTLNVGAGEAGVFPVFTQGVSFYASAPVALATDVTRVRILNYRQEPIANPIPIFSDVATSTTAGAGTTALIAAGISGTLEAYTVYLSEVANAAGTTLTFQLKDHATGTIIDQTIVALPGSAVFNGFVLQASGAAIRFSSGIDVVIALGGSPATSEAVTMTARYRTP
jgi:hypothetical protein